MRRGAAALVGASLALLSAPSLADGIDCRRPATAVERTICADPTLHRLDTAVAEDFRDAVDAAAGATRQALLAQQRSWLRERDRACRNGAADCLAAQYQTRHDALAALTARISPGNPDLSNATAVALIGAWKIGGYLVPNAPAPQVSERDRPWYLPKPGTTMTGQPGKLCDPDGACQTFGLDRQALAAVPDSGQWSAALGLAPSTPFYVAYLDGKSVYGLIPRQDGSLLAQFNLCDASRTTCGPAFQVWTPAGPAAAVRVLAQ